MASFLVTVLLSSCGLVRIGDYGADVYFRNETGDVISVYERTSDGLTTPPRRVEPGTTFHNQWVVPPPERRSPEATRRVEATDASGNVIYCRIFTYAELDKVGWTIEIKRGEHVCI